MKFRVVPVDLVRAASVEHKFAICSLVAKDAREFYGLPREANELAAFFINPNGIFDDKGLHIDVLIAFRSGSSSKDSAFEHSFVASVNVDENYKPIALDHVGQQ